MEQVCMNWSLEVIILQVIKYQSMKLKYSIVDLLAAMLLLGCSEKKKNQDTVLWYYPLLPNR